MIEVLLDKTTWFDQLAFGQSLRIFLKSVHGEFLLKIGTLSITWLVYDPYISHIFFFKSSASTRGKRGHFWPLIT